MNEKIAPLALATIVTPLMLVAPAIPAMAQTSDVVLHETGQVTALGQTYESMADYHLSPEFVASGRRCGAPEPTFQADFAPSDCSLSQTSIEGDYDPSAGQEYVVQVVMHVLSSNGTGDLAESLVTSQIDILNEDFRALAGTPGAPGNDAKITFVLATSDPDGNPTDGINRVGQFFNNADSAAQLAWDPERYLNIYSANLGGGILGYVQGFPQSIAGTQNDGAWIRYTSIGRNSPGGGVFNQGRTLTHEVGHYMGLRHIWGDESTCNNGYTNGDLVADTVPSSGPASGCPTNANTCGAGNNVENYMDYSNDTCMDNFTVEQVNRMRCVMAHYRSQLYNALPIADFGFEPSEFTVVFTDMSSDADGTVVAWEWDFGDGNSSTEQNPTHTFASYGVYDVKLTVTDDRGVRASKTESLIVNIAPNASFDYLAAGVAVDFTDTSSDANGTVTAWEWDFGDGTTSTDQNPTHSYSVMDTYTVTLTVTDDLGSKTSASEELDLIKIEEEEQAGGCGCTSSSGDGPLGVVFILGVALLGLRRRRR